MAKSNKLIESHMYIAGYLARKYCRSNAPYEDLYQEGCIGLIKAYNKFDPSLGFKFSTYATWWVKQAILSSLTRSTRTIRLPRHIVQLKLKIYKYTEKQVITNGKEPTISEIAIALEISEVKIKEILSLQLEADVEDFEDFIITDSKSVLDNLDKEEESEYLIKKLSELTKKEKIVVGLKYGLLNKIE